MIRDEQMRALSAPLLERWIESHLREHFPARCSKLTDDELRKIVRGGIGKARRYGLGSDADICRFVDISLVMGSDFDVDPRLPWAAALLNDPAFTDASVRLEMLFEAACAYLRKLQDPTAMEKAEESEPDADEEENEEQEEEQEGDEEEGGDADEDQAV